MTIPDWVSEGSLRKYHRAIADFTLQNKNRKNAGQPLIEVTEEMLKEHYTRNGGLVLGDSSTVQGAKDAEPALGTGVVDAEEAEARAAATQGKTRKTGKK